MSYEHDLIDRAVQVLAPEDPSIEGLLRRRDRKRRNQRLAAGAVGLAIGIAVMALGAAFLRAAGDAQTADWPHPSITNRPLVQPGEVLLDPHASGDNPTYVIAADVATGAQRTVAGCRVGCRLLTPFDASADGGWIAYHLVMCGVGECGPADPEGGLWVVGAGVPPRLALATPRVFVGGVDAPWSWSPIGAQLAFADVNELILLDPTTWERTRIATAGGTIATIVWGPDGRSIAYSVKPPSAVAADAGSFGVFVVRSGTEPKRVSDGLGTDRIDWSPDGNSLVLDRIESDRSVIEVAAADGSDERVLVEGPNHEGPGAPVWSPDGSRIAFIRTPRAVAGYSIEIWVIGADGRGELRLGMTSGSWGGGPVWSPDSQLVAWSSVAPGYWVAVDADRGGFPEQIDQLVAEQWQQG
jgi:dipeptidyl aminopeptidase/acylaminoacyl peptidase